MIYIVIGFVLCILAFVWISYAKYYSGFGWIGVVIGGYFIIKGREKIGLKKNNQGYLSVGRYLGFKFFSLKERKARRVIGRGRNAGRPTPAGQRESTNWRPNPLGTSHADFQCYAQQNFRDGYAIMRFSESIDYRKLGFSQSLFFTARLKSIPTSFFHIPL